MIVGQLQACGSLLGIIGRFHLGSVDATLAYLHPCCRLSLDYADLASALLTGAGIGDLPPNVQPQLVREGQLIEVMPKWRFRTVNLWLVHLGNRFTQRSVRVFQEFATKMAPKLFPDLPT